MRWRIRSRVGLPGHREEGWQVGEGLPLAPGGRYPGRSSISCIHLRERRTRADEGPGPPHPGRIRTCHRCQRGSPEAPERRGRPVPSSEVAPWAGPLGTRTGWESLPSSPLQGVSSAHGFASPSPPFNKAGHPRRVARRKGLEDAGKSLMTLCTGGTRRTTVAVSHSSRNTSCTSFRFRRGMDRCALARPSP